VSIPGANPGPTSYRSSTGIPAITLTPEVDVDPEASIGTLVKDATTHLSTLVRAEIELAKLEITASAKQAVTGGVFFIGAAFVGIFLLFFAPFVFSEILDIWLPRWASFLITIGLMVLIIGALVFLGIRKIKKIKKPEKTISTLKESAEALRQAATHSEV